MTTFDINYTFILTDGRCAVNLKESRFYAGIDKERQNSYNKNILKPI